MTAAPAPRRMVLAFFLGLLAVFTLVGVNSCITGGGSGSISSNDDSLPVGIDIDSFAISGDLTAPLEPGLTSSLDLSIRNPFGETLAVRDLAVTVTSVDAPNATTQLPCTVKDFTTQKVSSEITLKGDSTTTLSSLGLTDSEWPQVSMLNTDLNQDGCKGATLSLTYSGTGVKK